MLDVTRSTKEQSTLVDYIIMIMMIWKFLIELKARVLDKSFNSLRNQYYIRIFTLFLFVHQIKSLN